MNRLLIATHNAGKRREFASLLGPLGFEVVSSSDLGLAEPEETATSFAIGWKGHYHIEGSAFIYTDRDSGRVRAIFGYPTQAIARAG